MMKLLATKIFKFNESPAALYGLCKGAQKQLFYSCGSDKFIREWNLATGMASDFAVQFSESLYSVCYEPQQHILAAGASNGTVYIVDLPKKLILKEVKLEPAPVFDLKFSAVNNCFIAASGAGTLLFMDAKTFEITSSQKLCSEKVRGLDMDRHEQELAVACGDGSIRVFDLSTKKQKLKIEAHGFSANAVKFHPDGKHLITGGRDALLKVWQRNSDAELIQLHSIPAHNFAIYSIAFHPNGKIFATGSRDKTIKIWDAKNFDFLLRISKENQDGHFNSVNKIYWSDYADYLISTGDDRSILTWKIEEE